MVRGLCVSFVLVLLASLCAGDLIQLVVDVTDNTVLKDSQIPYMLKAYSDWYDLVFDADGYYLPCDQIPDGGPTLYLTGVYENMTSREYCELSLVYPCIVGNNAEFSAVFPLAPEFGPTFTLPYFSGNQMTIQYIYRYADPTNFENFIQSKASQRVIFDYNGEITHIIYVEDKYYVTTGQYNVNAQCQYISKKVLSNPVAKSIPKTSGGFHKTTNKKTTF